MPFPPLTLAFAMCVLLQMRRAGTIEASSRSSNVPVKKKRSETMRMKPMMLIALGCLLLSLTTVAVASEHHEYSLKVGKKGEITLTQPTQVGDRVLQPGTYVVQHRTSGNNHFVRFVELKQLEHGDPQTQFTYTEADNAGEIKCLMEPPGATATETTVQIIAEGGGNRITRVAIKGENAVHDVGRVPRD
jgi:hypothetical protein